MDPRVKPEDDVGEERRSEPPVTPLIPAKAGTHAEALRHIWAAEGRVFVFVLWHVCVFVGLLLPHPSSGDLLDGLLGEKLPSPFDFGSVVRACVATHFNCSRHITRHLICELGRRVR